MKDLSQVSDCLKIDKNNRDDIVLVEAMITYLKEINRFK